jgi:pyrroloquinoline quinone biosynthesis protein E
MNPAPPLGLIIELTHRCPLQCAYCSNPLALDPPSGELTTEDWQRVLAEAAALGVLQVHFSGGEPMARRDLEDLTAHAHAQGLYTNLITSGLLLDAKRMSALAEAGLDHVQLSFQDSEIEPADAMAGSRGAHRKKLAAAELVRQTDLPLTANFVIQRDNVDRVEAMLALGETLGAQRIEIAHVQYYGWALRNRAALMPSPAQLDRVTAVVTGARERLKGQIVIDYVVPDYYAARPKACMGGWGQRVMNLTPTGLAMPCHAAGTIKDMSFVSVQEQSLGDIWARSEAFTRFRGTDWMPEPCRSCDRKEIDWGGCRCQALALVGDAARTDPVCAKSPDHNRIADVLQEIAAEEPSWTPRRMHNA